MILTVYIIIIVYFLIGFIGLYFINRKKEPPEVRKSWLKTIIYFVIINIVSLSIIINPIAFRCLAVIIILEGFYEIFKLFRESGYKLKDFFLFSVLLFALFSTGFFIFSGMEKELIFYSFAITAIFDSFSQITGQLWGRRKILPKTSPNKTVGGFIGGTIVSILSALIFRKLIEVPFLKAIVLTLGVAVFSFIGDALTSYYKRKYVVKDFRDLIPEHGGFLDRFDSLIAGGAIVAFLWFIMPA
jgi:phosphatidate cytidylyltransferase